MKPKILVVLGPTATGKSNLAVTLAKKFNGEVISADSRQVYKGLDIGTGKISEKEMHGIPHHLLDITSPKKVLTTSEWKDLADKEIDNILSRGRTPIICGGTGFYIESVVDGVVFPEVPPNIKLRKKLHKKSSDELVKILRKLDPKRLKTIDQKNPVRLVRAIEIAKFLGHVPKVKKQKNKYNVLKIGLCLNETEQKEKIHTRLLKRLKAGMIKEAENLHKKGLSYKRMRELGLEYRYLADFLEKMMSKKELINTLEKEIWQYVRRQITWFKRDDKINWFEPKESSEIVEKIKLFLAR